MSTLDASVQINFGVGRYVQGSLYKCYDKEADGTPRVYPAGHAKAGQPKITYWFACAYKKAEAAWWETAWGKQVLTIGQTSWPQGQWSLPTFAWKIEDGDSTVPNKAGKRNCDMEGFAGCWIVNFSSQFAPKIYDEQLNQLIGENLVKCGWYIEVLGTVKSNTTARNPGVYINFDHVMYRAPGPEIVAAGSDPRAAVASLNFGRSVLPPGVSAAPLPSAGAPSMPGTPHVPAGTPTMPGMPAAMPGVPGGGVPAMPGAPPIGVAPNPSFIQPPTGVQPAVPPAVGVSAPPPPAAYVDPKGAPSGYRMVNAAGPSYSDFVAQKWTNEQLLAHNHMVRL